jgi:trk system potassium uptake protein TrkA
MKAIIIGAGQVGSQIAADLADQHTVTVLDTDPDRIDEISHDLDVLAQAGSGTDMAALAAAGVADADRVIASTDDDETNIAIAGTVKAMADVFTIARVKRTQYHATWNHSTGAFGVDFMVCTNKLTAEAVAELVDHPVARDLKAFADGAVEMMELELEPSMPIVDTTVATADTYPELTFAGLLRDGEVLFPDGSTTLRERDHLVVIGTPAAVAQFETDMREPARGRGEIVIAGATEIGQQIAAIVGPDHGRVTMVDDDPARARVAAEALPDTVVKEADPTDIDFLEETDVGAAEAVIAALDSDDRNLLVSLLAHRLGVERTIAVIDRSEYVELFEAVGVDTAVNPRDVVAEELSLYTREGTTESIAFLDNDRAEVLEITAGEACAIAGIPLTDLREETGLSLIVGAIVRDGELLAPRGETAIAPGDQVVLFIAAADRDAIEAAM